MVQVICALSVFLLSIRMTPGTKGKKLIQRVLTGGMQYERPVTGASYAFNNE